MKLKKVRCEKGDCKGCPGFVSNERCQDISDQAWEQGLGTCGQYNGEHFKFVIDRSVENDIK